MQKGDKERRKKANEKGHIIRKKGKDREKDTEIETSCVRYGNTDKAKYKDKDIFLL
jgi:hypothetical protein